MVEKPKRNYLIEQHRKYIVDLYGDNTATRNTLRMGDFVVFQYEGEFRYIFVVAPYWEGKLHGIDLNRIPRLTLMRFANLTFDRLTPITLYDKYLSRPWISQFHAYRTFDWKKITAAKYLVYNTAVQPSEEDTANVPDPKEDADGVIL